MADHSSASAREHTPHENQTRTNTIVNALKRRAQAVLNDESIDPQSRAIIRYALEINDPWLARLVRRVDAGERIDETFDFEETTGTNNDVSETNSGDSETNSSDSKTDKISAFIEIICRAGDEPKTKSAALLVLMAIIENARYPDAVASAAKYGAAIRCAHPNLGGIDDADIEMLERRLLAENGYLS